MKQRLKKWGIQKQIRIAFLFLTISATLMTGIGSYLISKHIVAKNYRKDFQYCLEMTDKLLNIHLNNIVDMGRFLLRDKTFMNTLGESEKTGKSYFANRQEKIFETALSDMVSKESYISEAAVIDCTGKMYCYRINTGKSTNYIRKDILNESWMQNAFDSKGKEIFYRYNVLDKNKDEECFSLVKKMINIYDGSVAGVMVINIRKQLLNQSFVNLPDNYESNSYMVLDKEGAVVYFQGDESNLPKILNEYQKTDIWRKIFVFSEANNSFLGWQIVSVVKKNDLTKTSIFIGIEISIIIACVFFLSNILSKIISRRIYRPLNQLEIMIQEVGKGERELPQVFDDSEVGQIGEQFKKMVTNNLELRENLLKSQVKEREAELMLLQAQINPHFLYNTLDSIYCRAIINRQNEIAQMVEALGKTFRLSLNQGKKLIPVSRELEHIKNYMEIQNIRFNNKFELHIDVPASIYDCLMLKLVLQPFVENSMYHGLEPKIGKGDIWISAEKNGNAITFYIKDNGVGIDNIEKVYQGYGVNNVIERIHLFYGDGFGVEFTSEPGNGTCVMIRIREAREEDDKCAVL